MGKYVINDLMKGIYVNVSNNNNINNNNNNNDNDNNNNINNIINPIVVFVLEIKNNCHFSVWFCKKLSF